MAMVFSQNGWKANDRSLIATYTVPGTDVKLPLRKGNAAVVLLYIASQFNKRVEPLVKGHCWGYAERPIRGQNVVLSNHASGTADDLNAPEHPRGVHGTFSQSQIKVIEHILKECYIDLKPMVRWGGHYTHAPIDAMHFEIIGAPPEIDRLAKRLTDNSKATKINAVKAAIGMPKESLNDGIASGHATNLVIKEAYDKCTKHPQDHLRMITNVRRAIGLKSSTHPTWDKQTTEALKSLGFTWSTS